MMHIFFLSIVGAAGCRAVQAQENSRKSDFKIPDFEPSSAIRALERQEVWFGYGPFDLLRFSFDPSLEPQLR